MSSRCVIRVEFIDGIYRSYLDNELESFPHFDENTKEIRYHPAVIKEKWR